MKFKVGDKVLIHNPRGIGHGKEAVITVVNYDEILEYRVAFRNGPELGYAEYELYYPKTEIIKQIIKDL